MILDQNLLIDFKKNYEKFIVEKVKSKVRKYYREDPYAYTLFEGWINERIYLEILEPEDNSKSKVLLFFGNIKNNNSPYEIPTPKNNKGYLTVHTNSLKKLPKTYRKILKKRHFVANGKDDTVTSLQRLVAASKFNLKNKQVHHIKRYMRDVNNFNGLFPANKYYHKFLHGKYLKKPFPISFRKRKRKLLNRQKIFKRPYTSKYWSDRIIFTICYDHYIKNGKDKRIARLKIKGLEIPKLRTIQKILAKYVDFSEYYNFVKS